jgi:hypothetical protein
MMDLYVILKIAHVIGACVLFGTGLGIAFFMWMANRTAEPAIIAVTVGIVVIADTIFTATAVVAQPVTGVALAHMTGIPLLSPWLVSSLVLYLLSVRAGCRWSGSRSGCGTLLLGRGTPASRCRRNTIGCSRSGSSWAGPPLPVSLRSSC